MTLLFLFACLFKPQSETLESSAFERLIALEPPSTPNVEIVYAEIVINGELAY